MGNQNLAPIDQFRHELSALGNQLKASLPETLTTAIADFPYGVERAYIVSFLFPI